MADTIGKWAPGACYGPVLTPTDLYLLKTDLHLNPILTNSNDAFQLLFDVSTGQTGGYNHEARDRDLPFTTKEEPATLPRVTELIIITEISPWCTIVRNESGVTLEDVCTTIWKDFADNYVTDREFQSLPSRLQEQVRRHAQAAQAAQGAWGGYYQPAPGNPTPRLRRSDWLRDRVHFDKLIRKDSYISSRLGYAAPNIFVMQLNGF